MEVKIVDEDSLQKRIHQTLILQNESELKSHIAQLQDAYTAFEEINDIDEGQILIETMLKYGAQEEDVKHFLHN